jgi:hypothetical protein
MGELVDLKEWQIRKQKEQDDLVTKDLERLKGELEVLIADMESESGPAEYTQAMMDLLPKFTMLDSQLDGYYDSWIDFILDDKED